MSKVIRARYEKGVLKPLEPVDSREGEEVQVIIQPDESIAEKFYGMLESTGLSSVRKGSWKF